jgi:hypothetical protein
MISVSKFDYSLVKFYQVLYAAGRARKGPAPLNLEVPQYEFNEVEGKLIIG